MKNYCYFIENTDNKQTRNNSRLFILSKDLEVNESDIYIDKGIDKSSLTKLLDKVAKGDRLLIHSVVDLSEEAKELLAVLQNLQDKEVRLCSIEESYLNGLEYYTAMKGFLSINRYYQNRRRKQGYDKAKEDGKVGRPKKSEAVEKALRLYRTKAFTIEEIEKLSGVSSSTLYRALKEVDRKREIHDE